MRNLMLIWVVCFVTSIVAQPPTRFFTTFGADGDDVAYSCKPAFEQKYIVAGSSTSYGSHGGTDAYLVKVDTAGFPIWSKFFGGIGMESAKSVIQLPDSGYVMVGYTNSFGNGGYDIYLLRTDKNGEELWSKTWGGADWEYANDVILASDNTLIVVGNTYSFGNGKSDAVLLKLDLQGTFIKEKFFGGQEEDDFRAVIKTNDDFLAVVGATQSLGDLAGDGWILKLGLDGDTLWTRRFDGGGKDHANDVVQLNNGNYVIAGARTFSSIPYTQSYMVSLDASGGFVWENNYYHSSLDEEFISVARSFHLPDHAAFLKNIPVPAFSEQGNVFVAAPGGWPYKVNSFGGEQDELFSSIEGTPDGGYVSIGSTESYNSKNKDVFMIRMDSTIINYTSIVGIPEYTWVEKGFAIRGAGESIILNSIPPRPVSVSLLDMDGRQLFVGDSPALQHVISRETLKSRICVMRIEENGDVYYYKICLNE